MWGFLSPKNTGSIKAVVKPYEENNGKKMSHAVTLNKEKNFRDPPKYSYIETEIEVYSNVWKGAATCMILQQGEFCTQ